MVESIRADADTQARQIVDSANAVAREEANRIEDAARNAREEILAKAREATGLDRERMLQELKRELGRLVVETTARVTGKVLTPPATRPEPTHRVELRGDEIWLHPGVPSDCSD